LKWCRKIAAAIFDSLDNCPIEFRLIFQHIQNKVKDNFRAEQIAVTKYTAVSGFIFLRFFCPAILGPKLFSLMDEHPDVDINRTLILIAKTLQNLGNLVEFSGDKEGYMVGMNEFVVSNVISMKKFIDELANPILATNTSPTEVTPVNLEKELASIHRHLKKNFALMQKEATQAEQLELNKLSTILENLEKAEELEKQKLKNAVSS